jgi:hypothetical protein
VVQVIFTIIFLCYKKDCKIMFNYKEEITNLNISSFPSVMIQGIQWSHWAARNVLLYKKKKFPYKICQRLVVQ